jgi:alpha-L-rhamnosidase
MRQGLVPAIVFLVLASPATWAEESTLSKPGWLRSEYLLSPLGIDVPRPRLSWHLAARDPAQRGQRQTAYQILVASSAASLARDQGDRWDSGRVQGDASTQVEYAGRPLTSGAECYWKVRVWDAAGRPSPWSTAARFSMGLLQPADWTARWITGPVAVGRDATTLPLLRKRFRLDKPVRRATLYVASLGYHRVELNGQKVGDHEFDPVQSDYSRRVYYVTHDVTGNLIEGPNAIAASLGKGWYWRGLRGVPQDRPALRLELVIEHVDGSQFRQSSDASWKAAVAPVQLLGGQRNAGGDFGVELYDARQEQPGWNRPEFDDSHWTSAETLELPPIRCSAQMIAPNRVVARLPAVAIHEPQPGQYLLDFGKNLTGRLRMKVAGSAGAEIGFTYYASHTGDHTKLTENFRQADRYICRGGAGEEFCSQFNWRAFRFVRVTGLACLPALADAVAELITTDLPPAGTFQCSQPILNRLHELVVHTHRCITLGGIQVDCPHRERLGYGAEGQAGLGQTIRNFDAAAFYTKWARDFQDGQDPASGMVYHTAPFRIHSGGGPAWPAACIVYPWYVYLYYGDRRVLEEGYPTMRRWLACLDTLSKDDLLVPYGLPKMGTWQYLGDWASPRRPNETLPCNGHWTSAEDNRVFNDLHHYLQVTMVARIATILGRTDEARAYLEKAAAIRQAINRAYFDPKTARYTHGEQQQTYLALPLMLDVVPAEHRARVLRNLVDDIVDKRGGHLDFGVLGSVYTLATLVREGRSDLIYRMATRPTWPGWRWMIDQGATTLWEHWRPGDSSIHNSFLAIDGWFYSGLAGIRPDTHQPGFRHVILRPQPVEGVNWVKVSYMGMYGVVESRWSTERQRFTLEATIPPGSTATIYLPAASINAVEEGGKPAAAAACVRSIGMEADRAVFQIQAGRYRFMSPYRNGSRP